MSDIAKRANISRQALYLHFPNRADLLIATTHYLDEVNDVDTRLLASRNARTGIERLSAFIEAWGNYIPEIYGVAKALMAMMETDQEAGAAWNDRLQAVRHGCRAVVDALIADNRLSDGLTPDEATDLLWVLLSVGNWEKLRLDCGWSQERYIAVMSRSAKQLLVK